MAAVVLHADPPTWRAVTLSGRGDTYACDVPGPTPEAPAVVLLHGWTATGIANWSGATSALADRYRVIVLDHRGHGRGLRSTAPFSLEDCADDVVALLDALAIEDAVLVGYSMGGPIAQLVWRRHRHRVRALVLCATAADFTSTLVPAQLVPALAGVARLGSVVPRWLRMGGAWPVAALMIGDRSIRTHMRDGLRAHDERVLVEAGRAICAFDSTTWIGDVDVPVTVVITDRDRIVRPELQRELAERIPTAEVIHVDAAHMAPFTRAEQFADAVRGAVDQVTRVADVAGHLPTRRRRWLGRWRAAP